MCALAVVLAPAAAKARGDEGPCDALVDDLREAPAEPSEIAELFDGTYAARETRLEDSLRSAAPATPAADAARVTPACRAEVRRGGGRAAIDAARAWARRPEPGWIDRGRVLLCAMQDRELLASRDLERWLTDGDHPEARALCARALASWPEAEELAPWLFARAVREARGGWAEWDVDEAVVAVANAAGTPELREQLAPVLAAAHEHHARGYARLRDAVCTDDGAVSTARARACATLPAGDEDAWRRTERPGRWTARAGATAVYGLLVAAAPFEQNHERRIPTVAGVLGGYMAGITATVAVGAALHVSRSEDAQVTLALWGIGSSVTGAVLGGLAGHALATSPGARAGVTAVGLAPLYLYTLAWTFE